LFICFYSSLSFRTHHSGGGGVIIIIQQLVPLLQADNDDDYDDYDYVGDEIPEISKDHRHISLSQPGPRSRHSSNSFSAVFSLFLDSTSAAGSDSEMSDRKLQSSISQAVLEVPAQESAMAQHSPRNSHNDVSTTSGTRRTSSGHVVTSRYGIAQEPSKCRPTSARLARIYNHFSLGDWIVAIALWGLTGLSNSFPNNEQVIPGSSPNFERYDLMYPHHASTISNVMLFVLSFGLVGLMFIICAYVTYRREKNTKLALMQLNNTLLGLIWSGGLNVLFTETLKKVVGAPRPNFFHLCDWDAVAMACRQNNDEARSSFPSGHSSISFCALGFLSLFLMRFTSPYFNIHQADDDHVDVRLTQEATTGGTSLRRRGAASPRSPRSTDATNNDTDSDDDQSWLDEDANVVAHLKDFSVDELEKPHHNQTLRIVLCSLPICLAGYIASTRITDYWHHYVDVLAGAVLGLSVAKFQFSLRYPQINRWVDVSLKQVDLSDRIQHRRQAINPSPANMV
jgi:membrane-associated phospholipid phosphatase